MNLKKGMLRIVVLVLWLVFWVGLVFVMLPLFELTSPLDWVSLLAMFVAGFYLPAMVIMCMNSAYSLDEQIFDLRDVSSKLVFVISVIAGAVGLVIYAHIEPFGPHPGPYICSTVVPFMFIFGSYVFVCWILKGFQDTP
jgi:ABC-type maltose transport system permease subunit